MSDLMQKIKDMSHVVTEKFLINKEPINSQIAALYHSGEICNEEVLKRVCELVNQNVYLALFNDSTIDNSNIQFDYANYDKLVGEMKENEAAMNSYSTPPSDFRVSLGSVFSTSPSEKVAHDNTYEKLANINMAINDASNIEKMMRTFESIRDEAVKVAEQSYLDMERDAKTAMGHGDSIGDLAKIASRYTVEMGLGFHKVAAAYDMISGDLETHGHDVRTDITKVSSQRLNYDAQLLKPIEKFATAVGVVEAMDELIANMSKIATAVGAILEDVVSNG